MLMAAEETNDIATRGRTAFDADVALRRAVERCLQIVGEAGKAVSQETRVQHPEVSWTSMARIRDRLSHHYHRIDPDQLWTVATSDIPALVDQPDPCRRAESDRSLTITPIDTGTVRSCR
ncbi:MAG: DUF86 domain-containing protein [Dermatophilaceae bacterium]